MKPPIVKPLVVIALNRRSVAAARPEGDAPPAIAVGDGLPVLEIVGVVKIIAIEFVCAAVKLIGSSDRVATTTWPPPLRPNDAS